MSEAPALGSRAGFTAALVWGFAEAIAGGARRIVCVDADFADWPFDDAALHGRLSVWLRGGQRRLVLLASSFDEMRRRHPRFVQWRRDWSHAVEAWSPPEGDSLPTVLFDDRATSVEIFDREHWRGRASSDARAARLWRERIDAVLQRSEASFPVNSLGL
jgi:hypothetical protein